MGAPASPSVAYLAGTRLLVEQTIGRPLRRNEQHVDVFGLTAALDLAKDDIDRAIRAEQARAVRRGLRDSTRIRLRITRPMLAPLERLYRHGKREAAAELRRAGYPVGRRYNTGDAAGEIPELAALEEKINRLVGALSIRVESQRVTLNLAGAVQDAIATALLRLPGGRSIAAGAVSTALFNGMGATFEEHADLVAQWEYSSVLDGGTCDVCAPLDGTVYDSLHALFEVLPNFGPNPDCEGGDRCRCRAVPAAA